MSSSGIFLHVPHINNATHRMYMITPRDQISQDLSYFSGPSTSGAGIKDSSGEFYHREWRDQTDQSPPVDPDTRGKYKYRVSVSVMPLLLEE